MSGPRLLFIHSANSGAVGYYRSRVPARALKRAGYDVTYWEEHGWPRHFRPSPEAWIKKHAGEFDLIMVDRDVTYEAIALLAGLRHYSEGCRMVVDTDDLFLDVPKWNQATRRYGGGQTFRQVGLMHLQLSELVTVSTEPLRERLAPLSHAIAVAPNRIDPADWTGLYRDPERGLDPCLRIIYGGASGHMEDLDVARPGLKPVLLEPPVPLRFMCFGAMPAWLHEIGRRHPGRIINLPWLEFKDYPQATAWGGYDLAIAPLAEYPFNLCKSHIKWLECAVQGIPLLCSKVGPYAEIPDGCAVRVPNTATEWESALRALLTDPVLRENVAREAHEAVMASWTLDHHLETWQGIIEMALSRPRIESLEDIGLAPPPAPLDGVEGPPGTAFTQPTAPPETSA